MWVVFLISNPDDLWFLIGGVQRCVCVRVCACVCYITVYNRVSGWMSYVHQLNSLNWISALTVIKSICFVMRHSIIHNIWTMWFLTWLDIVQWILTECLLIAHNKENTFGDLKTLARSTARSTCKQADNWLVKAVFFSGRDDFMKIESCFLFQLFDGIECEFPIFFIYMMIDGKSSPPSIIQQMTSLKCFDLLYSIFFR